MFFEWDSRKNEANRKKHGFWFQDAISIFNGFVLSEVDRRKDYGETRLIGIGALSEVMILTVVYTERDEKIRIISARKANSKEKERYFYVNGYSRTH